MEIFVQILKQLPPGWPRVVTLIGLGCLFLLPEIRRVLGAKIRNQNRLEDAKQLLEIRKLQLEVAEKKSNQSDATENSIDNRIEELVVESESQPSAVDSLNWQSRLKFALAGSFALMLIGSFALWHAGKFTDQGTIKVLLLEFCYTVICGLLASSMNAQNKWECVLRGVLIPAFLGALIATIKGGGQIQ